MEEINRDKMLTVPVSQDELNVAKHEADKIGMSVSAFVRLLIKNFADGIIFQKKNHNGA